jgi:hypothetical protein
MHNKSNPPTGKLWIWYSDNASEEEEKEWQSIKKIIIVGHSKNALQEVFSQGELDSLNTSLSNEGWIGEIQSPRLTKWIKPNCE